MQISEFQFSKWNSRQTLITVTKSMPQTAKQHLAFASVHLQYCAPNHRPGRNESTGPPAVHYRVSRIEHAARLDEFITLDVMHRCTYLCVRAGAQHLYIHESCLPNCVPPNSRHPNCVTNSRQSPTISQGRRHTYIQSPNYVSVKLRLPRISLSFIATRFT